MTKLRHLYIDEETHRLAKVQASKEGLTIQKWLEKTIKQETVKDTENESLNHICEEKNEK